MQHLQKNERAIKSLSLPLAQTFKKFCPVFSTKLLDCRRTTVFSSFLPPDVVRMRQTDDEFHPFVTSCGIIDLFVWKRTGNRQCAVEQLFVTTKAFRQLVAPPFPHKLDISVCHISNSSHSKHQWCGRDRNLRDRDFIKKSETKAETWNLGPRLEIGHTVFAEIFIEYFKKMSSPLPSCMFVDFLAFFLLFGFCFPAGSTDSEQTELWKLYWAIWLKYSKFRYHL